MGPVLGFTSFEVPDLANNDMPTSSQALDELWVKASALGLTCAGQAWPGVSGLPRPG
jgi:hypothetical protein